MFTSTNQSLLKRLAMVLWGLSFLLIMVHFVPKDLFLGTMMDQSKREKPRNLPSAGPSTEAQFSPRSTDPVWLAASDTPGYLINPEEKYFKTPDGGKWEWNPEARRWVVAKYEESCSPVGDDGFLICIDLPFHLNPNLEWL
jgi:hypothetical protein